MRHKSYDELQITAKLKACRTCKRKFYFTRHERIKCMWCRSKATK
jgi:uncharacterized membrane protein